VAAGKAELKIAGPASARECRSIRSRSGSAEQDTGAFMAFRRSRALIAFRYLRARREEGFISVIAGFSLIGITLGVGTLIVVMS